MTVTRICWFTVKGVPDCATEAATLVLFGCVFHLFWPSKTLSTSCNDSLIKRVILKNSLTDTGCTGCSNYLLVIDIVA